MLPLRGMRQSASVSLASCEIGGRRRRQPPRSSFGSTRSITVPSGSTSIATGKPRKAAREVMNSRKTLPVGVVEHLGAVDVGGHELRLAGERPALRLAVGARDLDRVRPSDP